MVLRVEQRPGWGCGCKPGRGTLWHHRRDFVGDACCRTHSGNNIKSYWRQNSLLRESSDPTSLNPTFRWPSNSNAKQREEVRNSVNNSELASWTSAITDWVHFHTISTVYPCFYSLFHLCSTRPLAKPTKSPWCREGELQELWSPAWGLRQQVNQWLALLSHRRFDLKQVCIWQENAGLDRGHRRRQLLLRPDERARNERAGDVWYWAAPTHRGGGGTRRRRSESPAAHG